MGRIAQGGWVETARRMDRVRTTASEAGLHDPIARVVDELGGTRQAARRLLAAYDVVAPDLGRLAVVASLGSVETLRLLSEVDPAWAARIRDDVLSGGMPLSAVKDCLESARSARAVPPGVADMDLEAVLCAVRGLADVDLPFHPPKGIAEDIAVDAEYRAVGGSHADEVFFVPVRALLVSPMLTCSRSRGRTLSAFVKCVMAAVSMYRFVVVAVASPEEREAIAQTLAECRYHPDALSLVVIGPGSGVGAARSAVDETG